MGELGSKPRQSDSRPPCCSKKAKYSFHHIVLVSLISPKPSDGSVTAGSKHCAGEPVSPSVLSQFWLDV